MSNETKNTLAAINHDMIRLHQVMADAKRAPLMLKAKPIEEAADQMVTMIGAMVRVLEQMQAEKK